MSKVLRLGDVLHLDNPVDQIRLASAPEGARFVDPLGWHWKMHCGGLVPTLTTKQRSPRQGDYLTVRLYALPSNDPH